MEIYCVRVHPFISMHSIIIVIRWEHASQKNPPGNPHIKTNLASTSKYPKRKKNMAILGVPHPRGTQLAPITPQAITVHMITVHAECPLAISDRLSHCFTPSTSQALP